MMPETPVLTSTGRTVREAVESASGAFSDAACRRLIADLLRTVERQQALHAPHRIIMPDTVLVQADGAAELLAPLDEDDAPLQPPVAADLKAIAAVAHYAISGESPPAGALLPRGLAFEDDLLQAIDACLYGDRNTRPQTVEDMRRLMGMPPGVPMATPALVEPAIVEPAIVEPALVEPVTAAPAPAAASMADELEQAIAGLAAAVGVQDDADAIPHHTSAAPVKQTAPQDDGVAAAEPVKAKAVAAPPAATAAATPPRASRWLLACLAVGVLGAGGLALYQKGRQAGAEAVLAAATQPAAPAPAAAAPAVAAVPPIADPAPVAAAPPQQSPPAPTSAAAAATPAPVSAAAPAARPPSVTYQLRIKPWGEIWVDGVKRGISPPLKTLTLSGVHRVRIDNPDFPSQEMTVGTAQDTSNRIDYDFR